MLKSVNSRRYGNNLILYLRWHAACIYNYEHSLGTESMTMTTQVIQDWTDSQVAVKGNAPLEVRYRVFRHGAKLFQEIHSTDGERLHTLELPDGMALEKSSYEVLLRYALTDLIAA